MVPLLGAKTTEIILGRVKRELHSDLAVEVRFNRKIPDVGLGRIEPGTRRPLLAGQIRRGSRMNRNSK